MLGTRLSLLGVGLGQPPASTVTQVSSGSGAAWGHMEG